MLEKDFPTLLNFSANGKQVFTINFLIENLDWPEKVQDGDDNASHDDDSINPGNVRNGDGDANEDQDNSKDKEKIEEEDVEDSDHDLGCKKLEI